ncbi:unnamed protein product [Symbiodinium microadriaticum]|nr:unnamed protein product [Symbiodinium microadriaticum]
MFSLSSFAKPPVDQRRLSGRSYLDLRRLNTSLVWPLKDRSFEVVSGVDLANRFYFARHVADHTVRQSNGDANICEAVHDGSSSRSSSGSKDNTESVMSTALDDEDEPAEVRCQSSGHTGQLATSTSEPSVSFLLAMRVSSTLSPECGSGQESAEHIGCTCTVDVLMQSSGLLNPVLNFYYWEFVAGKLHQYIMSMAN